MRRRRLPLRHDLLRIFVAQFVERKRAAPCDRNSLGDELGRVDRRQPRARAQVPLAVRKKRVAAFGERLFQRGSPSSCPAARAGRARACGRRRRRPAAARPRAPAPCNGQAGRDRRRGPGVRRRSKRGRERSRRPSARSENRVRHDFSWSAFAVRGSVPEKSCLTLPAPTARGDHPRAPRRRRAPVRNGLSPRGAVRA